MIWRVVLVALASLCSTISAAETVKVRSGEHSTFSRLVLEFEDRPGWRLERIGNRAVLRTKRPGTRFETSDVFRLMPRTRIQAISQDPETGSLSLDIACDCDIDVTEIRKSDLIIDVRDMSPRQANRRPRARPELVQTTASEMFHFYVGDQSTQLKQLHEQEGYSKQTAIDRDVDRTGFPVLQTDIKTDWSEQIVVPVAGTLAPRKSEPSSDIELRLPQMDSLPDLTSLIPTLDSQSTVTLHLAEQLARAAAQGLIDVEAIPLDRSVSEHEAETGGELSRRSPVFAGNFRIETGIDRDMNSLGSNIVDALGNSECAPGWQFSVEDWGAQDAPILALSSRRAGLVGEFDRVNEKRVQELARFYIFLSFGAEAKSVLGAFPAVGQDLQILLAMADIMDDLPQGNTAVLGNQIGCDTAGAMWAAMALDALPPESAITADTVVRSFNALPAHLRRHLGPDLASKYLSAGNSETAHAISNSVRRAHSNIPLVAEMLLDETDPALLMPGIDQQRLEDIALSNSKEAARALIRAIDKRIAKSEAVDDVLLQTAASLAFERDGTPFGKALKAAEIRGYSANTDYSRALRELARAHEDRALTQEDRELLLNEVLGGLAAHATNDEFVLDLLRPEVGSLFATAGASVQASVLERIMELGFIDVAKDYLSRATALDADRSDLYKAMIAKSARDWERVEALLNARIDAASLGVLADATASQGLHRSAATRYLALGNITRGVEEAWRAGDLQTVASNSSPEFQGVLHMVRSQDEILESLAMGQGELSLATSTDLLANSTATRNAVAQILGAFPKPDTQSPWRF